MKNPQFNILLFSIFSIFLLVNFSYSYAQEDHTVELLLNQGIEKINQSEYENSIELFNKVLEIEPDNIVALSNKGFALLKIERNNDATLVYDKILEIDPSNIDALSKMGAALLKLERDKDAIYYFDKVLKIDENNISAISNKGVVLAKLENYQDALIYFNKVLEINPNDFGAIRNKGLSLIKLDQHDAAIKIFDILIEMKFTENSSIVSKNEIIKTLELVPTKHSKYYAYLQLEVRNSSNELVGFIESDNVGYLPISYTEEVVNSFPITKIVIKDNETYELRQITTVHSVSKFHPFNGLTNLFDVNSDRDIIFFSTLHHGFPVVNGDSVTTTWNIMKKIST